MGSLKVRRVRGSDCEAALEAPLAHDRRLERKNTQDV
jgi:hypothetical protein